MVTTAKRKYNKNKYLLKYCTFIKKNIYLFIWRNSDVYCGTLSAFLRFSCAVNKSTSSFRDCQ